MSGDSGAPNREEVTRITNAVTELLGECDLESALTVVCNLAGQLAAALAEGSPRVLQEHLESVQMNIKKAANNKMLYDYDKRRAAE